ncbi:MAG: holo-[acyl-carrier-protein] synthase [Epulopiscium sp. Nele67-Bin005]|nr:MAG: holo-[acyl-carrier-protein] synthase [Epulopiscium sp. Nele67-Bin005]
MIFGLGTDIIEIDRIAKAIEKMPSFCTKAFTDKELQMFLENGNKVESIAGNFATKEAFSKALGTGFRNIELREVQVLRDSLGKPYIELLGNAQKIVLQNNINNIHVSISHCKLYAVATVILEK